MVNVAETPTRSRPRQAQNPGLHDHRDLSSGGRLHIKDILGVTEAGSALTDHHKLLNLTVYDDHPQYLYLAGRTSGQTAYGGLNASGTLTLSSTAHATKSDIFFGSAHTTMYDELNDWLGVGVTPTAALHIKDSPTAAGNSIVRPSEPSSGSWGLSGAGTKSAAIADVVADGDTSIIQSGVGATSQSVTLAGLNALSLLGTWTLKVRVREVASSPGSFFDGLIISMSALAAWTWYLTGSGGVGSGGSYVAGPTSTSYQTFTLPINAAQAATLYAAGSSTLLFTTNGDNTGVMNVTQAYLEVSSVPDVLAVSIFDLGTTTTAAFALWRDSSAVTVASISSVGQAQFQNVALEDPGAGTGTITLKAPTGVSSWNWTMPPNDGNANDVLITDGSGTTSWAALTSLLSASSFPHALLDSTVHTDTLTGTVVRGALIVGNSTPKWAKVLIGAANSFFGSDGTDAAWTAAAALTKTDDTNVTLTLGGTPTTALLRAASLTLGWTGTLAVARGGTGLSALEFPDNQFRIIGSGDGSKKIAFEVDGLPTATTRTLTPQNTDYIIAGTNVVQQTFSQANFFYTADNTQAAITIIPVVDTDLLSLKPFSATVKSLIIARNSSNVLVGNWSSTGALTLGDDAGTGNPLILFNGNFSAAGSVTVGVNAITTGRTWNFPDFSSTFVGTSGTQTLTSKTLTTPTIASFTNAQHNHTNAAGGGTLTAAALAAGSWTTLQTFPDNAIKVVGSSDATKAMLFELDNATAAKTLTINARHTVDRTQDFADSAGTHLMWNAGTAGRLPLAGSLVYGAGINTALTELAIGSNTNVLTITAGVPAWGTNLSIVDVARTWSTLQIFGSGTFQSLAVSGGVTTDDSVVPVFNSTAQTGTGTNDFLTVKDTSSLSASGFTMILAHATLTASRRVTFPDGTGQLVTTSSVDTLTGKTLGGVGGIRCSTSTSASIKFQNASSTTQFAMFDLSAITAQRNMKWPNEAGGVAIVGNQAVASGANATAAAPGKVDVTAQGADFAQAQIVTTASVGFWRIDSFLEDTTAGAGSGIMTTTWGWTDDIGATTDATQTLALTAVGRSSFSRIIYVASGHITIKCLNGGAYLLGAQYALRARATFLG